MAARSPCAKNASRENSTSCPYSAAKSPTNPTGEAFAATIRSFSSRKENRGGSVAISNPVLCDSHTPTASCGTSAISRSLSRAASADVSATITLVAHRMPTSCGSRPSLTSAASISLRCSAISFRPLPAPNTWSTNFAAAAIPRCEPPAWISTG